MHPQIEKVTHHIQNHLDDDLDLHQLAKISGYSHFHFCRIFKVHLGESAMSYVTRLKLERAANEILHARKNMLEIALDAGYQTPTGFLKAFKSRFNTTPSQYKRTSIKVHYYKETIMNTPQIVTREAVDVIYVRELGAYEISSDKAWKRLTHELQGLEEKFTQRPPKSAMNLGIGTAEALGICHDDPQVTNEANIRYDAALAWEKEDVHELKNYGFETKNIVGGRYAMLNYMGDTNAESSWYGLYEWIEKNNYICRDVPAFEKYINGATETDPEKMDVEIYVPIE